MSRRRRRFAQHTAPRSRPCVHRRGVVEKRFTRRKAARPLNARSTRYSRFVVFFHAVALTRAACRATRQWWSILLCGTLLEACLALGPQIRRAAKLGNPFSTYTKNETSGLVASVFSGPCTSPEAFGVLGQLLVFLLGSTGPGADVSRTHTYLLVRTQIPSNYRGTRPPRPNFYGFGGGTHPRGCRNRCSDIRG